MMNKLKAVSDVEQRLVFAREAKEKADQAESKMAYDYASEKMVSQEVKRARPILDKDSYNEIKNKLRAEREQKLESVNVNGKLSDLSKNCSDMIVRPGTSENIVGRRIFEKQFYVT